MKRILVTLVLFGLLALPIVADAQYITWSQLSGGIKNAMWAVFALTAVIMFIAAGIMFLTAGGDPTQLEKAKKAFLYGVIAVVVAILAFSIIGIIQGFITG